MRENVTTYYFLKIICTLITDCLYCLTCDSCRRNSVCSSNLENTNIRNLYQFLKKFYLFSKFKLIENIYMYKVCMHIFCFTLSRSILTGSISCLDSQLGNISSPHTAEILYSYVYSLCICKSSWYTAL